MIPFAGQRGRIEAQARNPVKILTVGLYDLHAELLPSRPSGWKPRRILTQPGTGSDGRPASFGVEGDGRSASPVRETGVSPGSARSGEDPREPGQAQIDPTKQRGSSSPCTTPEGDLIVSVGDTFGSLEKGVKYTVEDMIGRGSYGQVFRVAMEVPGNPTAYAALKVIKAKPLFFEQAKVEWKVMMVVQALRANDSNCPIVRLVDVFTFRNHFCLVFELLYVSLLNVLRLNGFLGVSLNLCRVWTRQVLKALAVIHETGVVHLDIKPENLMLDCSGGPALRVIDFGSALVGDSEENNVTGGYVMSRYYRSPEVLLGNKFNSSSDLWSVGCVAAELILGTPLFPGESEYDQVRYMTRLVGPFPLSLICAGKYSPFYYDENKTVKSPERYHTDATLVFGAVRAGPVPPPPLPPSHDYQSIRKITEKSGNSWESIAFLHLLKGLLNPDPLTRWTATVAMNHPFFKEETDDPADGQEQLEAFSAAALSYLSSNQREIERHGVTSRVRSLLVSDVMPRELEGNLGVQKKDLLP